MLGVIFALAKGGGFIQGANTWDGIIFGFYDVPKEISYYVLDPLCMAVLVIFT